MKHYTDVGSALTDLKSGDPELELPALEYLSQLPRVIAESLVGRLQEPNAVRYLIYERLDRLGDLAVPALQRVLLESADADARVLAAAALSERGISEGQATLLDAVRWGHPRLSLAVSALTKAGDRSAVPAIEEALRQSQLAVDFAEHTPSVIADLLEALTRLGAPVPADVRKELKRVEPQWVREAWLRAAG